MTVGMADKKVDILDEVHRLQSELDNLKTSISDMIQQISDGGYEYVLEGFDLPASVILGGDVYEVDLTITVAGVTGDFSYVDASNWIHDALQNEVASNDVPCVISSLVKNHVYNRGELPNGFLNVEVTNINKKDSK